MHRALWARHAGQALTVRSGCLQAVVLCSHANAYVAQSMRMLPPLQAAVAVAFFADVSWRRHLPRDDTGEAQWVRSAHWALKGTALDMALCALLAT